jgi:hypothetical protein
MLKSGAFTLLLVGILIVMCLGIASAASLNDLAAENKGALVEEVSKNPQETIKKLVSDYFTSIMKKGDSEGAPLSSFRIVNVDTSDPNNIQALVVLKYQGFDEFPAISYSVIKVNDRYQVQNQMCEYDAIPNSPTKGTVRCSKNFVVGSDGSVAF